MTKHQLDAGDFDPSDSDPRLVLLLWVGIVLFWIAVGVVIWLVKR